MLILGEAGKPFKRKAALASFSREKLERFWLKIWDAALFSKMHQAEL